MPTPRKLWTRNEFILTLNLYYKLPFGKLHTRTKEVQELATLLGRSVNSIALRLVNFAACDPYIRATGRTGMISGMQQCQPYWDEFANDREKLLCVKISLADLGIEQYCIIFFCIPVNK